MKKLFFTVLIALMALGTAFAQNNVKGTVSDVTTGEPLVGANVYLDGTTIGAATDMDGNFMMDVPNGRYTVICNYLGYKDEEEKIDVSGDLVLNFEMKEFRMSQSIVVVADRAKERETPVAFSTVKKVEMELKLASQDIPMVLNTTPSVYATAQGGGAGDARINIRGFNQRNINVMINGVPMNDMENGWVYWSNWDGLGDATSDIQIQRGMSAVNLATPAIGGTMNIITDPSARNMGFLAKGEYGSGNFYKASLFAHTGTINEKWAISAGATKKIGDGVINSTWTDAWSYYIGTQYTINANHRLEFYAMGAPQRHGQNLYRQNIAAYDSAFAMSIDGFDHGAVDKFTQSKDGRLYNENWNTVNSSYKGKQWDGAVIDRYDPNFINERENFFHKPLLNFNWFWNVNDNLNLITVLYWSGGVGGGTGTYENRSEGNRFQWDYASQPTRIADWDANIAQNIALDGSDPTHGSAGILRNSRNNQWTVGGIVKAYYKMSTNLALSFGIDWRTAEIDHFREVRDLLGGTFFDDVDRNGASYNDFRAAGTRLKLGDKINYDFTNTVDWIGAYAQAEYTLDKWTIFGTAGWSGITYKHTNHFKDNGSGGELTANADMIAGYQFKTGAAYRVNAEVMTFVNLGYISKVPILDAVIDDNDGTLNPNPQNEKFSNIEAGAEWRSLNNALIVKANIYYTLWQDRSFTRGILLEDNNTALVSLTGVDQTHMGFEVEASYKPIRLFQVNLMTAIANWEHKNDATGQYKDYSAGGNTVDYSYALKGLKIGDAPQTQLALGATFFPIPGMSADLTYRYYMDFYADWDPTSREYDPETEDPDRVQSWKTPSYGLLDFHFGWLLPVKAGGMEFNLYAHVLNVLDELYISDAVDNSRYNSYGAKEHKAHNAEVYVGIPRTFNLGLSIVF